MKSRFYLVMALLALVNGVAAADIIPASRRYTWEGNIGIPGGIPNVTTIYTNLPIVAGSAIVNAWNACPSNQAVFLSNGVHSLSANMELGGQGKVLRGRGIGVTILEWSGFSTTAIMWKNVSFTDANWGNEATLTEDALLGTNTLTMASVPSWVQVGDLFGLDELDDGLTADGVNGFNLRTFNGQGERNISQIHRCVAKTATTITTEIPVNWTYRTAQTAQIFQLGRDPSSTDPLRLCGMEDLTLRFTFTGSDNAHPNTMDGGADRCWFKNVEIDNMPSGRGWWVLYAYRSEWNKVYVHDSHNYNAGQGYGLDLNDSCTSCVVENSIFKNLHLGVSVRYGAGGNVLGYNAFIAGNNSSAQPVSISHHGNASFQNLYEGNYCEDKLLGDWTHGSSVQNTVFRNRILGVVIGASGDRTAVSIEYFNRYWNIVGNGLGDGSHNKLVSHQGSQSAGSQGNIYKIGGEINVNNDYGPPFDQWAYTNGSFILMHGNADTITSTNNGVIWNHSPGQAISEQAFVKSYYIPSGQKPSFWPSTAQFHGPNYGFTAGTTSLLTNKTTVENINPAIFRALNGSDPTNWNDEGTVTTATQQGSNRVSGRRTQASGRD